MPELQGAGDMRTYFFRVTLGRDKSRFFFFFPEDGPDDDLYRHRHDAQPYLLPLEKHATRCRMSFMVTEVVL